jgi:membrane protease YdiL (CAAX protease family)
MMKNPMESLIPRWLTALIMFVFSAALLLICYVYGISGLIYYYTIILACLVLWIFVDHQCPEGLGIRFVSRWWIALLLGLGLGAAMMFIIVNIALFAGWVTLVPLFGPTEWWIVCYLLISYAFWQSIVAGGEELVMRGYIQQNLATRLSIPLSVVISSIMFGVLHLPKIIEGELPALSAFIWFVNLIIAGFLLGWTFVKTGTLWLPIGIHFSWNYVQYHIIGIGGEGLYTVNNIGAELLTGGVAGPEAGLLGTLAFLLLILIIWLLPKEWLK